MEMFSFIWLMPLLSPCSMATEQACATFWIRSKASLSKKRLNCSKMERTSQSKWRITIVLRFWQTCQHQQTTRWDSGTISSATSSDGSKLLLSFQKLTKSDHNCSETSTGQNCAKTCSVLTLWIKGRPMPEESDKRTEMVKYSTWTQLKIRGLASACCQRTSPTPFGSSIASEVPNLLNKD